MGISRSSGNTVVKKLWRAYWGLITGIIIFFFLVGIGLFGKLPSFKELEDPSANLASEIFSADSVLLGKFYLDNRTNVDYGDLSPNLVNALLATEDIRFYGHTGIDIKGTSRAILFAGKKGGGSTITQQLAKNLFNKPAKNIIQRFFQKAKEYIIAIKLERSYTKEEIIAMYLNTVDFVNNANGIQSASLVYFGKYPIELEQQEAAMLVGMLQNPSLFNPLRFPERSLDRRNYVFGQMLKYDYIDRQTYDSLSAMPLGLNFHPFDHRGGLAPYFRMYLAEQLKEWAKQNKKADGTSYNIYKDGLKIYTTINSKMQGYAEEAVSEHLTIYQDHFFNQFKRYPNYKPWESKEGRAILRRGMLDSDRYRTLKEQGMSEKEIEKIFHEPIKMRIFTHKGYRDTIMSPIDSIKYHRMTLQTGLLAIEPETGYVRAWVGGVDFTYFKYDHVNVNTKRQVGSTFKPILYALAIDNGFSPCTVIPNTQVTMHYQGQVWQPRNSSKSGGSLSLRSCLAVSSNNCAAYLMKQIGPKPLVDLSHRMGITTNIPVVPSISLGAADISLYEMITAYSAFVNLGMTTKPNFLMHIDDSNGNVIQQFFTERTEVLSELTSYVTLDMMRGPVLPGGTAARVRTYIDTDIAGKTGTTNNNTDGWFIGATPQLLTGIWVGCDDPILRFQELAYGQGGRMAMPIWGLFYKKIYADKSLGFDAGVKFNLPSDTLALKTICGVRARLEGEDEKGGGLNIIGTDPLQKQKSLDDEFEM
jgi:penicillin-binding protein 1A